jgi:nucleoside-diphosphate-sugar epimerase
MPEPLRVLIVGGTAFIGPHVVRRLCELGHDVTVFHRGRTEVDLPAAVTHVHGDRAQLPDFAAELSARAPDVVLDMIPMSEADARALMDTFRGTASRVVAISSEDVYRAYDRFRGVDPGPPERMPLTEESPLRARLYPYRSDPPRAPDDPRRGMDDYEKILVERVVMNDPELPGTVLRLPAVYGPGDGQHRLLGYLKRMDDRRPAILLDAAQAEWQWSRGYVENVAAAIALAVADERTAGRIYNVAEPEALPESEWVRTIAAAAGWPGQIVAVPRDHLPVAMRSDYHWEQHWVVDTSRIRQELGYSEPITRDEALRRSVEWERAHPPAEIDPAHFDYAAEDAVLAAL